MGEIVVNEFLSFEGFVDSSYSHTNLMKMQVTRVRQQLRSRPS